MLFKSNSDTKDVLDFTAIDVYNIYCSKEEHEYSINIQVKTLEDDILLCYYDSSESNRNKDFDRLIEYWETIKGTNANRTPDIFDDRTLLKG